MELEWIPLYTELAQALLSCKNNRKPLVDWIYSDISQVGESSLVEYLHMHDGSKITDIDPFSVFAIFNRPLRVINRVAMLQLFKKRFSLKSEVPTDFNGIPTVNSQRAFFFSWDDNGERINDLWEIFENVIQGKDISLLFDKVIADGVPKYSLTMVLYWISPYNYLNLDGRNRMLLKKYGFADDYPHLTYAEYTQLMQDVKNKMAGQSIPYNSFPDFSLAAYSFSSDSKVWMYKRFEDAFAKDYIRMGSDAKGKLDFASYKTKKALGDAYRKIVGNTDVAIPNMYWQLMKDVRPGDIVVVFDSMKEKGSKVSHLLYGWGKVTSDVIFDKNDDNPIHRMVEWHKPLPQEPIEENMTSNTRYFHQVKGVEADNIMSLLGINNEEEITMDKDGIDAYIQLLKTNKNLILTGAPGTGKTYLAKAIAKQILKIEDDDELQKDKRFGFVQFHPSYDYTDFVEGLRPVNNQSVVGFKRQDGVFKSFCKQAILSETADAETLSDINDNPTVWKVSLGGTYDNPTRTDCLDNGYIRIGWHEYGDVEDFNDYTDFQYGGKNVLRAFQSGMQIGDLVVSCYSAKEVDAIGVVTGEYDYRADGGEYPRYRGVRWLVKGIKENILELNNNKTFTLSTVYKANITAEAALKIVQKYSQVNLAAPKKDFAVFIIDEINRGEISKIFGELFFSIDPGYRGVAGRVKTQYQNLIEEGDVFKDGFYVPDNVYIIGTMNDIDRSVESMDFAMRRRFTWKEVTAKDSMKMLDGTPYENEAKQRMESLNNAILNVRGLGEAYQIGAAYFRKISDYNGDFQKLWDYHLKGLLNEYLRGNMNAKDQLDELKKAYDNEAPIDEASI
ncbi:AAA family ATPase [Prevotella sp. MA2016]|uniref:AAA family ATPase n=1 Tax=Prevotella sp. MA2016 TaxID=1408310 RepID=UPI000ADD5A86|nr:AAA family ATPase [Prevotella sp. MA2016]